MNNRKEREQYGWNGCLESRGVVERGRPLAGTRPGATRLHPNWQYGIRAERAVGFADIERQADEARMRSSTRVVPRWICPSSLIGDDGLFAYKLKISFAMNGSSTDGWVMHREPRTWCNADVTDTGTRPEASASKLACRSAGRPRYRAYERMQGFLASRRVVPRHDLPVVS
jgi:hypothetical protein